MGLEEILSGNLKANWKLSEVPQSPFRGQLAVLFSDALGLFKVQCIIQVAAMASLGDKHTGTLDG